MNYSASPIHTRIIRKQGVGPARLVRRADNIMRRLVDVVAAVLGLLVLSPAFAIIAILIKRDSPGPVFYWGPRVGKGGKPFRILKFRTMYERPDSYRGPKITGSGDPRITPMGHWLRDTKVNELPQLWNVLRGEMSLVGPRPEDPDIAAQWPEATRRELLSVRPGITSPASVLYDDEEELLETGDVVRDYLREILPGKLRLDSIYVRHRTLLSDLDVIFLTMVALLPLLRRRPIPEHALFWGPLAKLVSRYFSWFVVDFGVSLLAVGVAGVVWRSSAPLDLGPRLALIVALLIAVVFSSVNGLLGLHRIYWSKAPASAAITLALSTALATLAVLLVNLFWRPARLLPPGMLVVAGILAYGDFVLFRYRERLFTGAATRWLNWRDQARAAGERVLIVGAGELATMAVWLLRRSELAQAFRIVGMVDDAPRKQGLDVDRVRVLDHTANIPRLVQEHDIGLLLFAINDIEAQDREEILALCRQTSARVVLMPDILQALRARLLPRPVQEGAGLAGNGRLAGAAPGLLAGEAFDFPRWVAHLDELIAGGCWDLARAEVTRVRRDLGDVQAAQGRVREEGNEAHA